MAFEYNGRFYSNSTEVANAKARDKYTPQQMQIAQTIAYQQLPAHLKGRNNQMRVRENLAATAEALFGNRQQAAPAPPPPPQPAAQPSYPAPTVPKAVTTPYTKQITDLEKQIAQLKIAPAAPTKPPAPSVDYNALMKQMQISSQKQIDELMGTITGLRSTQAKELASLQAGYTQGLSHLKSQQDAYAAAQAKALKESDAARAAQLEQMAAAQRTYAVNQSRAGAAGNLQIQGATQPNTPGGTAAFRIRPKATGLAKAGMPTISNMLNI